MDTFYTREKNVQMLIFLMKKHGIKKVIASPGTTNITFVASIQQDSFFEIYSVADERSAAYMACGLAAESGEAVALTCTGATASRNYVPGLTEAFYRKLPVLAITSTQFTGLVGQLCPQVIDRAVIQNDIAVMSVDIPMIRSEEEEWNCNIKLNAAMLALHHRGGGPVHINLSTDYCRKFDVKELPNFRVINRVTYSDTFPEIPSGNIGIFIGSHMNFGDRLLKKIEEFCEMYNAVVFYDHTSNYSGKYGVLFNLICEQRYMNTHKDISILIDIGQVSGAYMYFEPEQVWRIDPDGVIRDTWKKITNIFEMQELYFFEKYTESYKKNEMSLYKMYEEKYNEIVSNIPDLPFSNIWIAYKASSMLQNDSVLHLGILNSLRSWNYFEIDKDIVCYCNTGGFGIDGIVSSFIGSALANTNKIHYLIVGDLAFFYDLNAIANKNIGNNIRILLVNNGCGAEFKLYSHPAQQFGTDADDYIAAKGHYGKKSPVLVKNYAENLGFKYICASEKKEFLENAKVFFASENCEDPILFEVFTDDTDESKALELIHTIVEEPDSAKKIIKKMIGEKGIEIIKDIIRRE